MPVTSPAAAACSVRAACGCGCSLARLLQPRRGALAQLLSHCSLRCSRQQEHMHALLWPQLHEARAARAADQQQNKDGTSWLLAELLNAACEGFAVAPAAKGRARRLVSLCVKRRRL